MITVTKRRRVFIVNFTICFSGCSAYKRAKKFHNVIRVDNFCYINMFFRAEKAFLFCKTYWEAALLFCVNDNTTVWVNLGGNAVSDNDNV